jgi:hypothetical protein
MLILVCDMACSVRSATSARTVSHRNETRFGTHLLAVFLFEMADTWEVRKYATAGCNPGPHF